jgi:hypothetical protein
MLYLWGPGLDAEVDYRRAELSKAAKARSQWRRLSRRLAAAGRDRPRPW